jgi:putative ABC transport system permease protein
MIFKLAWRNIWRNKRRTYITVASVFFAVLFATVVKSIHKGTWDNMVNNVINYYFGYVQIQPLGYSEEPSLDLSFYPEEVIPALERAESKMKGYIPRIESFALASSGEKTLGALLLGIDPQREDQFTQLSARIAEGRYFDAGDQSVMVGAGLAKSLSLQLGDTLVLVSMGYHGSNAAGKYPVQAIVDLPSPELSKQLIYLPLREAQYFYNAEGRITAMALNVKDRAMTFPLAAQLTLDLDQEKFAVLDWQALLPELVEAMTLDQAASTVILLILYSIITFGIFGTLLMMVKERMYEFGVLISIGMKRWKLILMVWIEILFIGLIGSIIGILLCLPTLWVLKNHPITLWGRYAEVYEKFGVEPILPAVIEPKIFFTQAVIVFFVTAILALYPYRVISRLHPMEAMRK